MSISFLAYIDESGDDGWKFGHGSTRWFVVSAVVIKRHLDNETTRLVDHVRKNRFNRNDKNALHFRKLRHEQRIPYADEISKAQLCAISVMVNKTLLTDRNAFKDDSRMYFYFTRYLIERISWYCRDNYFVKDGGNGACQLVFSNRSGVSYSEMEDYLDRLRNYPNTYRVSIHWDSIHPKFKVRQHDQLNGLQIADAVASGMKYAVDPNLHGYTEPRYARIYKPTLPRWNQPTPREDFSVLRYHDI